MSEEARTKVLKSAANFLSKARANAPGLLPGDYAYIAGDQVTIYYEEGGNIFDVTITWEEAKHFA
jgi:hypothetical protein